MGKRIVGLRIGGAFLCVNSINVKWRHYIIL